MDLQLNGKRALVTGASGDLGQAIAIALAREGVKVVVHGRNRERAEKTLATIKTAGGTAAVAIGGLDNDADAKRVASEAEAAFGGIDILINNAGGRDMASWEFHTPERWLKRFNENTVSGLRMAFLLLPKMQERKWGRLVQIGSLAGAIPNADFADYAASKAALMSMTVSIAQKFGIDGITSNNLAVGIVWSESSQVLPKVMADRGCTREEAERFVCTQMYKVPVGRFCRVEEVGNAVAFLSSPLAGYINGANIRLDGGVVPTLNP